MDEVNSVWETLGYRHPMRPKSKTESQEEKWGHVVIFAICPTLSVTL
jgi:hypothetical protein